MLADCFADIAGAMGIAEQMQHGIGPKGISPKLNIIHTKKVTKDMQSDNKSGRVNLGQMLDFIMKSKHE